MDTLRMPARDAFGVGLVNGGTMAVFGVFGGWLSDRIGRRAVMIPAACVSVAMTLPAFWMVIAHPTPLALSLSMATVMIPWAMVNGTMLVAITESFPVRMRSLAVGLTYAVAIAVFGGTTQLTVGALLHSLNDPMVPAYYRLAAAIVGILAILNLPESAPVKSRPIAGAVLAGAA